MIITSVRAYTISREMQGGLRNPQSIWKKKEAVIAVLETDEGLVGVGEGWAFGHSTAPVVELIEDMGRHIVGLEIGLHRAAWSGLNRLEIVAAKGGAAQHALSAIDIALWDLAAQASGQPLHRHLGACRDRVPVYASGGLYGDNKSLDDLADELAGYIAQGFRSVKIKVGGVSETEDVERVRIARDAIGPDNSLMIDGVWSYSPRGALSLVERIAPYNIKYFEAPVSAKDIRGTAQVNGRGTIAVCGQDHGADLDYYRQLLENNAVDVVLAAPVACGGVTECLEIGALARAFHKPFTLHSSSTAVSFLAALHIAATVPGAISAEYHQVHQLLFDALPHGAPVVEDGCITLPDVPGLGLSRINFDEIADKK